MVIVAIIDLTDYFPLLRFIMKINGTYMDIIDVARCPCDADAFYLLDLKIKFKRKRREKY